MRRVTRSRPGGVALADVRRAWRFLAAQHRRFPLWAPWLAFVVAAETLGRRAPSDLYDSLGVLAAGGLLLMTFAVHSRRPIPLLRALLQAAMRGGQSLLERLPRVGVDLRGDPPLQAGAPRLFARALLLALVLAAAFWAWRAQFPSGARSLLVTVSPSVYFLILACLWTVLLGGAVFFVALSVLFAHVLYATYGATSRPRYPWILAATAGAYWAAMVVLALWLDARFAVGAVFLFCVGLLAMLLSARQPSLRLIWTPRALPERIRVLELRHWMILTEGVIAVSVLAFSLYCLGETLSGGTESSGAPVTGFLGLGLAWAAAGAAPLWIGFDFFFFRNGWFRNPARAQPVQVHVQAPRNAPEARAARGCLEAAGFRVRVSERPPRRTEVALSLRPAGDGPAEPPRSWPMTATHADLAREVVHTRIRERDKIQRRRHLLKGLERTFKRAGRKYAKGSGFWLAPHLWFIQGLHRDEDDDDQFDLCVGPRYSRVLPLTARNHLYQVLSALEIDLIFVEDGIKFRQLRHVLRMLFEIYDIHGGRQAAEERHFAGIPGVRVILHSVEPLKPFPTEVYPEPDYEDIGRAKILHVFKDRGEPYEPALPEFDFDFVPETPSPALMS